MKKGRLGTMTHDYKRNGTTTLFAALNVLDGTVIGQNMQRHRHQEFIRFLNAINAQVPAGRAISISFSTIAGSDDGGQGFRLKPDSHSDRRRTAFR